MLAFGSSLLAFCFDAFRLVLPEFLPPSLLFSFHWARSFLISSNRAFAILPLRSGWFGNHSRSNPEPPSNHFSPNPEMPASC